MDRSKVIKVIIVSILVAFVGGVAGYVLGVRNNQTVVQNQQRVATSVSSVLSASVTTSADIVFPVDSGIINVKNYGAKGDGKTDDTAAIQKAISENLRKIEKGSTAIVYIPSGTYIVTNTILPKADSIQGGWSSHLTLQGQHRDKSIIKLKDNARGYASKSAPKAVLFTASSCVGCGKNRGDDSFM